jgi:adhesin/invasin
LLFTSDNQVNAMIPYDLAIETTHQLIVRRGTALSIPEPVSVLSSQSGVFTRDASGKGPGIVVGVYNDGSQAVVGPDSPVKAGDVIVIYCTGLGDVEPRAIAGAAASPDPPSRTIDPVAVTIGGADAPVLFAGLTPGFTGLYQVNAIVPDGVEPGDAVPVALTQSGRTSPSVWISVR